MCLLRRKFFSVSFQRESLFLTLLSVAAPWSILLNKLWPPHLEGFNSLYLCSLVHSVDFNNRRLKGAVACYMLAL